MLISTRNIMVFGWRELDPETLQLALLCTEDRTAYLGLSLLPVCN